ncbi:hypothetical protein KFK09_021177 [Dendrobium nobile]|uniref:X8 domain-containing protein n=1 Tax=Dendrobium nobile TaxID=94219 RepID=A0A8T3APF5_DENNO|nr:hypothetical protein KFK09_021177 [Dendrobium nobile]
MEKRIDCLIFLSLLLFLYTTTKFPYLCEGRNTADLKNSRAQELKAVRQLDSYYIESSPLPFPPSEYVLGPSSSPQEFPPFCVLPPPFPLTPMPPSGIFPTPTLPTQSPPPNPPFIIPSPTGYNPSPPEIYPGTPGFEPGTPIVLPSPPGFVPTPPGFGLSPPAFEPSPPGFEPTPPSGLVPIPPGLGPSPPSGLVPSPPVFVPGPPIFLPPIIFPPPNVPPPPHAMTTPGLWCVAKPTVPDPIIQEAMNYACGSGADCDSIQPNGSCYQPDTLISHASFAFNSYWQRTKVAGGTCDFGGTAMLITRDPSYDGCHFLIY